MHLIRRWRERLEAMAAAIVYAEAGDADGAGGLLEELRIRPDRRNIRKKKQGRPRPRPRVYRD